MTSCLLLLLTPSTLHSLLTHTAHTTFVCDWCSRKRLDMPSGSSSSSSTASFPSLLSILSPLSPSPCVCSSLLSSDRRDSFFHTALQYEGEGEQQTDGRVYTYLSIICDASSLDSFMHQPLTHPPPPIPSTTRKRTQCTVRERKRSNEFLTGDNRLLISLSLLFSLT